MRSGKFWLYTILALFTAACSHRAEVEDHEGHDSHEEHENHGNANIVIEPEEAQRFGIEYETVEPGNFQEVIKTSGTIENSSSDIFTVTARRSGRITLAPGINVGSTMGQGSRVATISSEGLEGGDVNQAARANLAVKKAEYERLKPLYEDNLVTASTFKEAERAYLEAEALAGIPNTGGTGVENSPVSGTLTELYVTSGQYVEMGSPIATIAKNSRLTLKAELPARYSSRLPYIESANFIPEGSSEVISLRELDGKKVSAGSAGSTGGYLPVYFSFSGNSQSHPGGYAEVFLLGAEKTGVVSVPRSSLLELQGNKYIYVVSEDGHSYEKRIVKTGSDNGDRVEIKEGLLAGEKIVAKGASVVRMAEVSAVAPPAHSHNH